MQALFEVIKNVKALDEGAEFQQFMSRPNAKAFVVNLNRWEQLYEQGVDARGRFLGHYAPFTLTQKRDPELSHITLRETGDFYNSFQVTAGYGHIVIEADMKVDLAEMAKERGWDPIGLTEDSNQALGEYMIENGFVEQIKEKILRG